MTYLCARIIFVSSCRSVAVEWNVNKCNRVLELTLKWAYMLLLFLGVLILCHETRRILLR